MKTKNNQGGYTIVETLVALTLLFILLFLVTELMPIISNKAGNELKLKAITAAKNQMEETLVTKNLTNYTRELEKRLIIKQVMEDKVDKILITITVSQKRLNRQLYMLKVYVPKIE